jgi:serine/threonine protein kinase
LSIAADDEGHMARFGSYDVLEEIGTGGMASVYRARQASMDRDVAIKVMHKSIASSEDGILRFQREARLIARLEHPHILPVYDFDGSHELPYIVMRYLNGGTLKEVMSRGQLHVDNLSF